MSTKQEILNWMMWNEPGEDFNSDAYFFYILDVEYENNSMEEENYEAYILLLKQLNYRLENDIFDDFLHTYYFYKTQRQRNELIKQANELNECFIEMQQIYIMQQEIFILLRNVWDIAVLIQHRFTYSRIINLEIKHYRLWSV